MKKWVIYFSILVLTSIAVTANGQSITQTYVDPCDNRTYNVTFPIPTQSVLVVIRGQARTFTYQEARTGVVATWVNSILNQPCPVLITQTIAQQTTQAASTAASQAAGAAAGTASSTASNTASSTAASSSSSQSSSSSETKTESSTKTEQKSESKSESKNESESKSESKEESKSEKKKQKEEEKKKQKEERRSNPPIVKADLSIIQIGTTVIPTFNINLSKSLNEGAFSYGINTSLRMDLKQFVIGASLSDVIMKGGKVKGVMSSSITYVTDWNNKFIFYGWSFVKPLPKNAVAGLAISGNTLLITGSQIMISPTIIGFYTRPYQISRKQVISPEIYVISSPVMFGQRDKKATGDPNISVFTGAGTDIRFSKRFKANINFKVNISTAPNTPLMSVLALGSKINI